MNYSMVMYLVLIFECILSGIFTGLVDISFEILLFVRIIVLFGSYFIFEKWTKTTLVDFLKLFILIVLVNDFVSLVGFIIPSVNDIITFLEPPGDSIAQRYEGLRFVGPGQFRYFEGGVVNCLAIVSILYLFSIKAYSTRRTIFSLVYMIIVGLFIARTAIVGLTGFIFIFSKHKETKVRIIRLIFICLLSLPFVFLFLDFVFHDNPALKFAFEMVYNVLDGHGFETESSNSLSYQYVFPTSIKTWLIGDGIWEDNNAYYMHTDVGYSRLMFLWGIVGCATFILFLMKIVKFSTKNTSVNSKLFGYVSFLIIIVLNAKGFTDICYFFIPVMLYIHRDSRNTLVAVNEKECTNYF